MFSNWITIYQTDINYYDALGRPGKPTLPEDVNSSRKELKAEYNRAGGIKKVHYDGTEYIKEMALSAKVQWLLVAFGNEVMICYSYFRLLRICIEGFSYTKSSVEQQFDFDEDTKKQDLAYLYDLKRNIKSLAI